MKHTLALLTALLLAPLAALHAANFHVAPDGNDGDAGTSSAAVLEIPPHPTGFPTNGTWSVYCRSEGSDEWREIPVALVRPGYQEFDEPFAKTVGLKHQGPCAASLVRFSFAGSLEIKAAFNKGDLRNVTMEKCDILTSQGVWNRENAAAIHIAATADNTISGVVFRDIRIESFRFPSTTALLMIKAQEFRIGVHRYSPGRVSGVLFDRVSYDGSGEAPSFIQGTDADHTVKGVVFRKFFWGDRYLSEKDHPDLSVRPFSSEITFQ